MKNIARRRARTRTVYRRAKRTYRRARGGGKKKLIANVIDGVLVGAGQGIIPDDFLFGYGDALLPLGVGWFRKNQTLQTIGGYQLGLKIASSMTKGGGTPGFTSQG